MKKVAVILAVVGLLLAGTSMAQASLTYVFDPNDLIDLHDQGPPLGTPDPANPRSVYPGGGDTLYPGYQGINAWNAAGYGSTMDLAIKADYLQWRDTDGGYITAFNIWLADNPRARGWGERLVIEPNTSLTATTAAGWSVEVSTNEWHSDLYYAEWTADNVADALKIGGSDIGDFSFSATLYVDENENGWDASDPLAVLGEDYTIWFGGYAGNDGIVPGDETILFQGTLDIAPIPEPASVLVWCLLGAGSWLGMRVWRRRRIPVGRQPWSNENRQAIHEIIARH